MIKVAILFGGSSREREVSFSGGRTVYDNLDKTLFEAIPVFVDSFNQLIELDWQYIYKGSIRDFYPPVGFLPESPHAYQVYAESLENEIASGRISGADMVASIGKLLTFEQLKQRTDLVFLALHGANAEDGTIQGILDWHGIPYTGSGILPSAIGINKSVQKDFFRQSGMDTPAYLSVSRQDWLAHGSAALFEKARQKIGLPFVIKAANQGSSIGISVVSENNEQLFTEKVDRAFFRLTLHKKDWELLSAEARVEKVREISDIRDGLGLPLVAAGTTIYHPEALLDLISNHFATAATLALEAVDGEHEVLLEAFVAGREFSCIVIRNLDGQPVALPPTEIIKGKEVFDYRSKYLPGLSRKLTPIALPEADIENIRQKCCELFGFFKFNVYARIDGFITADGTVLLNDPNTTSGMMPSSFFFHQAAEIGLDPSGFLTYIIETSLKERIATSNRIHHYTVLLDRLQQQLLLSRKQNNGRKKIAVIMGGYSSERHISVESGRNIYEKLASSGKYQPVPVFLTGSDVAHRLFLLPVNFMLKDNADDIREKVLHYEENPVLQRIAAACSAVRDRYMGSHSVTLVPKEIGYQELAGLADGVFIALHGRPGEDGQLQRQLEKVGLPYNGSGADSSAVTINKYLTNRILAENGFLVPKGILVEQPEWERDRDQLIREIEDACGYPLIAKPSDDGCSSAVKKIRNRSELEIFAAMIFRRDMPLSAEMVATLQIDAKEEVPMKPYFLVEELVGRKNAAHFLEITGGLLTHRQPDGTWRYEIFEPSEALAEKGILSLAEKFLAGEGQNITPARFSRDSATNAAVSQQVREQLEKAAKVLHIEGYARIDAFVRIFDNGKAEVIFIEVNSLPGMTPATCIFHQTAINGYKPFDFIDKILEYGFSRKKQQSA